MLSQFSKVKPYSIMESDSDVWQIGNDTTTAPHDGNTSEPFDEIYENNTYLSFMAIFSILVIISNSIVVLVVVHFRDLHLPTLWNIAFMASCDLLYGLHYMIFAIPSLYIGRFAFSENVIRLASISLTLLLGQNILNIFMTLMDRYISVCWPLHYPDLMSPKRFLIAVCILITINVARLCLIIFPKSDMYYSEEVGLCAVKFDTMMVAVSSLGVPFLTSVFIIGLLVKIGKELRCRNNVHPTASASPNNQFTITMSLAALVYIVCYIPMCITVVVVTVYGADNVNIALPQLSILIVLSNSFWNVIIYATTYRPFRNGFLKLFCRKISRDQARREVNIARTTETTTVA